MRMANVFQARLSHPKVWLDSIHSYSWMCVVRVCVKNMCYMYISYYIPILSHDAGKTIRNPKAFPFVSHSYQTTMKWAWKPHCIPSTLSQVFPTAEAQSMYSPGEGPWLDDYVDVCAAPRLPSCRSNLKIVGMKDVSTSRRSLNSKRIPIWILSQSWESPLFVPLKETVFRSNITARLINPKRLFH